MPASRWTTPSTRSMARRAAPPGASSRIRTGRSATSLRATIFPARIESWPPSRRIRNPSSPARTVGESHDTFAGRIGTRRKVSKNSWLARNSERPMIDTDRAHLMVYWRHELPEPEKRRLIDLVARHESANLERTDRRHGVHQLGLLRGGKVLAPFHDDERMARLLKARAKVHGERPLVAAVAEPRHAIVELTKRCFQQ